MPTISVAVIDDSEVINFGLQMCLRRFSDLSVVGHALDAPEAIEMLQTSSPDVALIDYNLPTMNAVDLMKVLKLSIPDLRIIIQTADFSPTLIMKSLASGADGYCFKGLPSESLHHGIRSVSEGHKWIGPLASAALIDSWKQTQSDKNLAQIAEIEPAKPWFFRLNYTLSNAK